MVTIYKYQLELKDEQVIELPGYSRPLSVGMQNGLLMLWAVVDTEKPKMEYPIRILGTGNPASEELLTYNSDMGSYLWEHVGTVMHGAFVWHVFCKY